MTGSGSFSTTPPSWRLGEDFESALSRGLRAAERCRGALQRDLSAGSHLPAAKRDLKDERALEPLELPRLKRQKESSHSEELRKGMERRPETEHKSPVSHALAMRRTWSFRRVGPKAFGGKMGNRVVCGGAPQ